MSVNPDDNFEVKDVELFASWGVQYFKLDGCYSNKEQQEFGYRPWSDNIFSNFAIFSDFLKFPNFRVNFSDHGSTNSYPTFY